MASTLLWAAQSLATRDRLALKVRRNWTLLDLRDLDASWPTYAQALGYDIHTEWKVSTSDALLYLFETLLRANNPPASPLRKPVFSAGHVRDLMRLTGPIQIKRLIDAGWEPQAASLSAARRTVLASQNYVDQEDDRALLEAAEAALDEEEEHVVQGYLRIARPTACAFCRRLAGATHKIGLVYNVTTNWRTPHENCKCRIEPQPVYRLMRLRHPEEIALTAQMYAALRRDAEEARWQAQRDLIAA